MIHIDNLDGEGTIFMSTDDGTQSIGHVEKEYASILQDVLESYDWYVKEVERLREKNELLRSMQKDGIEASAHDRLLLEINRLREDNEKLHDAINRSFHAKISGSALEIYNGWWEGEEE